MNLEITEMLCGALFGGFIFGIIVTAMIIILGIEVAQFIEDKKNGDE
ncbi:hypothetical protein [Solobacterium sp.]|nr:hypothetical protein [Solobacterium sp.]MBF1099401.1 hypothetical protein [Solobacterium sp.]